MVDRLNISDKVIVVADRGYESYNNMAHIQEKGWYFVIRAKASSGIITKLIIPNTETYDVVNELVLTRRQTKETLALFKSEPHKYRWLPTKMKFDYLDCKKDGIYNLNFRLVRF